MIKCPEHLKEKEKEIIELFNQGKISEGLKEALKCGLARVEFRTKCDYCKHMVKDINKYLCKDRKALKILMWRIPGLTHREAEEIWFAGDEAEEWEIPGNLRWDKTFEIMNKRKLKWRKVKKEKGKQDDPD